MFRVAAALALLALLAPTSTIAQTLPEDPPVSRSQTLPASQFRDVFPQDWAAEAIAQLDQRYRCLAGYPDGAFRGDRVLLRAEFAAALQACLEAIEGQIAQGEAIASPDLETLERLSQDYQVDLAVLRGRTDAVTARTLELEAVQFSPTTQLYGQVVFAVSDEVGGNRVTDITRSTVDIGNKPVVQHRTWIELVSSFSGRDRLITRLAGGNPVPILVSDGNTGGTNPANFLQSNDGRLAVDSSLLRENNDDVYLDLLAYDFPLSDRTHVSVFASGGSHFHYATTFNPLLDDQDGGEGSLSRFGQRNPLYGIGGDGTGLGITHYLSDRAWVDVGYLANEAGEAGSGVFQGNYSVLGQLAFSPDPTVQVGLTYVHAYNDANEFRFGGRGSATGSFAANLIPLALNAQIGQNLAATNTTTPVVSNSYGLAATIQPSTDFALSGWVGLTQGRLIGTGDATIWNWALALNLPDLGQPGNLGTLLIGTEPTLTDLKIGGVDQSLADTDSVWHLEASYRHRISDRVSVTPGFIWLPALNQNTSNSDVFIFTLQSLFQF